MLLIQLSFTLLAGVPLVRAAAAVVPNCAAGQCFKSAKLPPPLTSIVSQFCEEYIHKTPGTVTKTKCVTSTTTTTPAQATVTASTTLTFTSPLSTECSTTATTSLQTVVNYPSRGAVSAPPRREARLEIPKELTQGCHEETLPQQISSACSCFLTSKTTTSTKTSTSTITAPSIAPTTTTVTFSTTSTSTVCTSTSTSYVYTNAFCGVPSPTVTGVQGQITCSSAPPPGETDGRLRIEGGSEGTIFEGCVSSGPGDVTTPSGGTHLCDGTNDGSNPNPGATCTTQLNAAALEDSFPYDGTYDSSFQDYFITSIDQTAETSTQFWGLLQNFQFTPTGGCQTEIQSGGTQETLWAFDAFNAVSFLSVSPEYMVVNTAAGTVQITVSQGDGGGSNSPVTGATVTGGTTSDANGHSTITVPTVPGCYQFKATMSSTIRSNAFFLTVLPA